MSHPILYVLNIYYCRYLPGHVLVLSYAPFTATLYLDGEAAVVVNGDNKMFFEYHRSRQGAPALGHGADNEVTDKHQGKKIVGYWEDGASLNVLKEGFLVKLEVPYIP